jgi:hypothetical protein
MSHLRAWVVACFFRLRVLSVRNQGPRGSGCGVTVYSWAAANGQETLHVSVLQRVCCRA